MNRSSLHSTALRQGIRAAFYFGLTIGVATVIYRVIEKRFLRLKDRIW